MFGLIQLVVVMWLALKAEVVAARSFIMVRVLFTIHVSLAVQSEKLLYSQIRAVVKKQTPARRYQPTTPVLRFDIDMQRVWLMLQYVVTHQTNHQAADIRGIVTGELHAITLSKCVVCA